MQSTPVTLPNGAVIQNHSHLDFDDLIFVTTLTTFDKNKMFSYDDKMVDKQDAIDNPSKYYFFEDEKRDVIILKKDNAINHFFP